MPFDDPLKNFGQSAVDRLVEQERRDRTLLDGLVRPFGLLESSHFGSDVVRLRRLAENLAPVRMSEEAARLKALTEQHASSLGFRSSISSLSAMREASLAIAKHRAVETNSFGKLAIALSDQLNAASKLGFTHADVLKKATAASRVSEAVLRVGAFSQLHEIATVADGIGAQFERLAKERASLRGQSAVDSEMMRHIREAHIAMEAMASEQSAVEFVGHANGLLKALASIFGRFKDNTANEVRNMGLLTFLAVVTTFLTFWEWFQTDGLAEAEYEQLSAIQNHVREIHEQLRDFLESEAAVDEAFVSDLPRGLTLRRANIRMQPARQSELVIVLPGDTPVAIHGREKRWLKVVYRDPLANQLAMGWVYRSSIEGQSD